MSSGGTPRLLRAVLLASALLLLIVLGGSAVRLAQAQAAVRAHIEGDLTDGSPVWAERIDAWVIPVEIARFGLGERRSGNAVTVLWPDGLPPDGSYSSRCPFFSPQGVERSPHNPRAERERAAAECEHLDTYVRAAESDRFDFLDPEVRSRTSDDRIRFHHEIYHDVGSGVNGLLARARFRLEAGDTSAAEADLRAVVSLGELMLRESPDVRGLESGHHAVSTALRFFSAVRDAQGHAEEARLADSLRLALPPLEGCRGMIKSELPSTAVHPSGWDAVAEVVRRDDLPMAIRRNALEGIRLSWLGSPRELVLGPDPERLDLARDVAEEAGLREWWEIVDAVEPSMGYRRDRLLRMIVL